MSRFINGGRFDPFGFVPPAYQPIEFIASAIGSAVTANAVNYSVPFPDSYEAEDGDLAVLIMARSAGGTGSLWSGTNWTDEGEISPGGTITHQILWSTLFEGQTSFPDVTHAADGGNRTNRGFVVIWRGVDTTGLSPFYDIQTVTDNTSTYPWSSVDTDVISTADSGVMEVLNLFYTGNTTATMDPNPPYYRKVIGDRSTSQGAHVWCRRVADPDDPTKQNPTPANMTSWNGINKTNVSHQRPLIKYSLIPAQIWNPGAISPGITCVGAVSGLHAPGASTTHNIPIPTGLTKGDVVILGVGHRIGSNLAWQPAASDYDAVSGFMGNETNRGIFCVLLTGEDPQPTTITVVNTVTAVDNIVYVAAAYRGVDPNFPIDGNRILYTSNNPTTTERIYPGSTIVGVYTRRKSSATSSLVFGTRTLNGFTERLPPAVDTPSGAVFDAMLVDLIDDASTPGTVTLPSVDFPTSGGSLSNIFFVLQPKRNQVV
jgi:hypothetical protein